MDAPSQLREIHTALAEELPGSAADQLAPGLAAHDIEYGRTLTMSALPHVRAVVSEPDVSAGVEKLRDLVDSEIERRGSLLHAAEAMSRDEYLELCRDWPDGPYSAAQMPALVIAVEAFPALAESPGGQRVLRRLASVAGIFGIHVLLSTGQLNAMAAYAADFASYRIALACDPFTWKLIGLAEPNPPTGAGDGYFATGDTGVHFAFD